MTEKSSLNTKSRAVISARTNCAVCGLVFKSGDQCVKGDTDDVLVHAGCVTCCVCKKRVKCDELLLHNGSFVHPKCVAKGCFVCNQLIIPPQLSVNVEAGSAHTNCLQCYQCCRPIGEQQLVQVATDRLYHKKCLVCSICNTDLSGGRIVSHSVFTENLLCPSCSSSYKSCFCCERKQKQFPTNPKYGGLNICVNCSALDNIFDDARGYHTLVKLLIFLEKDLDIYFTNDMLANQSRDLHAEIKQSRTGNVDVKRKSVSKGFGMGSRTRAISEAPKRRVPALVSSSPKISPTSRAVTKPRIGEAFLNVPRASSPAASSERTKSAFPDLVGCRVVDFEYLNKQPKERKASFVVDEVGRQVTLNSSTEVRHPSVVESSSTTTSIHDGHHYGRCDCVTTEMVSVELYGGNYTKVGDQNVRTIEVVRRVDGIYVLRGLPEVIYLCHLGHEVMHAYLFLRGFPVLLPQWEEGLCNYVSSRVCHWLIKQLESRQNNVSSRTGRSTTTKVNRSEPVVQKIRLLKFSLHKLEMNESPIYGGGYRMVRDVVDRLGSLKAVLDQLGLSGGLPVGMQ